MAYLCRVPPHPHFTFVRHGQCVANAQGRVAGQLDSPLTTLGHSQAEATGVPSLLRRMSDLGIAFKDLHTRQSSLEDIFVGLVHETRGDAA